MFANDLIVTNLSLPNTNMYKTFLLKNIEMNFIGLPKDSQSEIDTHRHVLNSCMQSA